MRPKGYKVVNCVAGGKDVDGGRGRGEKPMQVQQGLRDGCGIERKGGFWRERGLFVD